MRQRVVFSSSVLSPIKNDHFQKARLPDLSAPSGLGSCLLVFCQPRCSSRGECNDTLALIVVTDECTLNTVLNRTLTLQEGAPLGIAHHTMTSSNGVLTKFDDVIVRHAPLWASHLPIAPCHRCTMEARLVFRRMELYS